MKYTIIAAVALLAMGAAQAQTPRRHAPAAKPREVHATATEQAAQAPTVPVQKKKGTNTTSIVIGAAGAVAAIAAANGMGGGGSSKKQPVAQPSSP